MRKNNTDDGLLTANFVRMGLAQASMFASVYLLPAHLPLLAASHAVPALGAFAVGMFLAGPFHAYLGDTYKRKHVFQLSALAMLPLLFACLKAGDSLWTIPLLLLLGACFGLAATAGITIAIDITPSARRSAGNRALALFSRLGMLAGVLLGVLPIEVNPLFVSMGLAALAALLSGGVHMAFRAPIGLPLCSLDRFFLPRSWLLFVNLLLLSAVPGTLLGGLHQGEWWTLTAWLLLVGLAAPATRMFVNLSEHCQRGTANTTCHLAMDAGVIIGMALSLIETEAGTSVTSTTATASGILLSALLLFFLLTLPLYRKKRVR